MVDEFIAGRGLHNVIECQYRSKCGVLENVQRLITGLAREDHAVWRDAEFDTRTNGFAESGRSCDPDRSLVAYNSRPTTGRDPRAGKTVQRNVEWMYTPD